MSIPTIPIPFDRQPMDLNGLIEQQLEAVRQALEEAKKDNPIHTATNGHEETSRGNLFYTFTLKDEWEPEANSNIVVLLDPKDAERTLAGTVLSVLNGVITFATETPLPQMALPTIALREDTAWLFERLLASLQLLQTQGEPSPRLVSKLFGLIPCVEGRRQPCVQVDTFLPDADQVTAVSLAMGSERAFIIGPPGTGKTSTECLLALEHLHSGKTVYLVAFTNVALDNAMKRLKQYCEASGEAHLVTAHRLVRLGKTKDLAESSYRDLTLSGIVSQQMGTLVTERLHLQQEQNDLEATITHLTQGAQQQQETWRAKKINLQKRLRQLQAKRVSFEQKEAERRQPILVRLKATEEQRLLQQHRGAVALNQVRAWIKELQGDLAQGKLGTQAEYTACIQAAQAKQHTLRLFQIAPWWTRALARLDGVTLVSLSAEVTQAERQVQSAYEAMLQCEQNRAASARQVQAAEDAMQQLDLEERMQQAQLSLITPERRQMQALTMQIQAVEQAIQKGEALLTTVREDVDRHQKRHAQIVGRLREIEEEERTATAHALDNAYLIGATLTSLTTNPYLRTRMRDAMIVDEASMASMGILMVAAAHARQHVTLVGDPLQLAPIVAVKNREATPHAQYWLGTDIFSHLGVTLADADTGNNQVVLLSQQSRMVPEIAEPDSRYIYGKRLKNRPDPTRVPLRVHPLPSCPLLLIDTSDVDRGKRTDEPMICFTARPSHGSSKYNTYHVECIIKVVRHLSTQISLEGQPPQIGIVTPYGAQRTRIRDALRTQSLLPLVHVGTVHSFQSLEYPIMIFDIVEAPGTTVGRFVSNTWGARGIAHDATRLINVAHSRARDKLIYIAHLDYINEREVSANWRYRRNHVLTRFVNYVNFQGHIDSREL